MTDKETLFTYRLKEGEETISDAKRMLQEKFSPRSIINRAYYAAFYAVLALFLKTDINLKTSKHAGIISIFDKDFVNAGKIDKQYSKILHKLFKARQEGDYKELVIFSLEESVEYVKLAEEFVKFIKNYINKS